jgi:hypothetical protein
MIVLSWVVAGSQERFRELLRSPAADLTSAVGSD